MRIVPALLSLAMLSGCARTVTFVDFEAGSVLHGSSRGNTLKIKMPDGEVLSGTYGPVPDQGATVFRVDRSGSSTQGMIQRSGGCYVLMTSARPGSKLVMEAFLSFSYGGSGAGTGEARTNDGRTFKIKVS